jgi:hypothetical protein
VTRARLAASGYAYVGLMLPAFVLGYGHPEADAAVLTGAVFSFLWFLGSLRARLVRYDPDGFYASVVLLGGAGLIAFQAIGILLEQRQFAGPAAACATTVIFGSSLAALRARKIDRFFGGAGVAGGVAVLTVGVVESSAGWTLLGDEVYASALGFMFWVIVTATYLLRR